MREILFRGKTKAGEWIEGSLISDNKRCWIVREQYYSIIPFGYSDYGKEKIELFKEEIISETVGQFTGLKDKNGLKIFEGDEVFSAWEDFKLTVEFSKDRGGFFPFAKGDGCGCCQEKTISSDFCEVIGNIHEVQNDN